MREVVVRAAVLGVMAGSFVAVSGGCSTPRQYHPRDAGAAAAGDGGIPGAGDAATFDGPDAFTGGTGATVGGTGEAGGASGGRDGSAGGDIAGTGGSAGQVAGTGGAGGVAGGRIGGTGGAGGGVGGSAGGTSGQMCAATQHNCSGTCVDNNSTAHCGALCDACQAPAGGTATCNGTTCDFTCGTMKKCATKCTSGCCADTDCPTMAGMAGKCDTSTNTCNYACAVGFKPCGAGPCIPMANCCAQSDCPGACRACSAAGTCVTVMGADDLDNCPGTCDASGGCKSKRGQTCMTGNGCIAGTTCAPDGYCCNTACTNSCEACDIVGFQGTCTPVAAGAPRSGHAPCGGTGVCAGSCNGQSSTCVFSGSGVICSAASCMNGTATLPAGCNGMGSCSTALTAPCNPFICGPTACLTGCTSNSQCASGAACVNGLCMACMPGQAVCPLACVNTSTDNRNCGSCGHDCLGGGCSGGTCQAFSLGTIPSGSSGNLILSGGTLYVTTAPTTQPSNVWRLDPNSPSNAVSVVNGLFSNPRCVMDGKMFWVAGDAGTAAPSPISVCSVANCSATMQSFTTSPGHIFADDNPVCDLTTAEVVWDDLTNPAGSQILNIYRATSNGTNIRTVTSFSRGPDFSLALGFVSRRSDRYFFLRQTSSPSTETLFYVPTGVPNISPISILSGMPGQNGVNVGTSAFANDSLFVWSDNAGFPLTSSVPLPNGITTGSPPIFYEERVGTTSAMDNLTFYGTFATLPSDAIGKCPVANCLSPSILFRGQQFANAFINDETALYWTTPGLGGQGFAVWKGAK